MGKEIIADANSLEVRIALRENGALSELQLERRDKERLVGNIYKGRVANVLPGMQAAFIDIGLTKNAFLYAGDILADKGDFVFGEREDDPALDAGCANISEMLKVGDDIMVQVLKQPGGSKGARVTTHITLPGRGLVLMPTVNHVGVSRKIENEPERERLKREAEKVKPEGMGLIVRTAAEGLTSADFAPEAVFLKKLWERVQKRFTLLSSPRLIHSEESLIFRTVRDMFTEDVDRFVINNREYYEKVLAVVNITAPHMAGKVEYFDKHYDVFAYYDISSKVDKILNRRVWLKCGAYIVVDETEALTVIDVNTGKYVGESDLQATILDVNLEAAEEIARQIRLRDISGIIVIDFIDMESEANREAVVERLKEACRRDRTKTNVVGITGLGLVEMTRKKMRRKASCLIKRECPYCQGMGLIDSEETVAHNLRREIIRMAHETSFSDFIVEMNPATADYLLRREDIKAELAPVLKERRFYVKPVAAMNLSGFKVAGVADAQMRDALKDAKSGLHLL